MFLKTRPGRSRLTDKAARALLCLGERACLAAMTTPRRRILSSLLGLACLTPPLTAGPWESLFNGIKVVDHERGSPLFVALVARSKYEKIAGFGLGAKGPMLLQDHGTVVRFRSIKIRLLPAP
jgi:hypothetical protein